jgi:3-methyladenine DNA glycosylase AlkD
MNLNDLRLDLKNLANPERARLSQRYFKTGKGQYAEGDVFIGLSNPQVRAIAKRYYSILSLRDIQELLNSKIHEHRFTALIILVQLYKKAKKDKHKQAEIFEFYLKNTKNINNWDLVDISAPNIVGDYSLRDGTHVIRFLVKSNNLWEKRIAVLATFAFIKERNFGESLFIADTLMNDEHDLIHKAVGWMLREVGNRNTLVLELFLSTRYKKMPRTMLRYAIEKFPEEKRKKYLKGEI